MLEGVLGSLLKSTGDDIAKAATKKAVLNSVVPEGALADRFGLPYMESQVPVSQLFRKAEYQPRVTASGRGTENSVFTNGYNEGMVDQPLLVRKNGDLFEVLGGHSRTLGMERRAAAGLPNPEAVKARIYENITDDQAKQIARAANQGGQYRYTTESTKG